jgi:hypothetical protein
MQLSFMQTISYGSAPRRNYFGSHWLSLSNKKRKIITAVLQYKIGEKYFNTVSFFYLRTTLLYVTGAHLIQKECRQLNIVLKQVPYVLPSLYL